METVPISQNENTENANVEQNISKNIEAWITKLGPNVWWWKRNLLQSNRKRKKWKKIGSEISYRKSLFFATKNDLEDLIKLNHLEELKEDSPINNDAKETAANNFSELQNKSFELSATDVFVEKAQYVLSARANLYFGIACGITLITLLGLIYFTIHLFRFDLFQIDINDNLYLAIKDNYTVSQLILILFIKLSIGTIVVIGAFVLISIAKALFHESILLYNKRHALRFGRLYIYLKRGNVNFKELEDAFKWNSEFTSAFKDMKTEIITSNLYTKIIEIIPELVKKTLEGMQSAKDCKQ